MKGYFSIFKWFKVQKNWGIFAKRVLIRKNTKTFRFINNRKNAKRSKNSQMNNKKCEKVIFVGSINVFTWFYFTLTFFKISFLFIGTSIYIIFFPNFKFQWFEIEFFSCFRFRNAKTRDLGISKGLNGDHPSCAYFLFSFFFFSYFL